MKTAKVNENFLTIYPLAMPEKIQKTLKRLSKIGKVKVNDDGFSYLDIDNDFINLIQPFLDSGQTIKPDYFGEAAHFIGAHISISYPEENIVFDKMEQGKLILFEISGLFTAELLNKRYYVLKVEAPDLIAMRKKYGLPHKLKLADYLIDLHITIAVQNIEI